MCGGKNKKYRSLGNECRLTRCPFVIWSVCLWSPVKMVCFFCFSARNFLSGRCLFTLAPNVPVLCDVAVSRHYTFNLKLMFNQGTNAEFCTSPAILQNTCYLPYFLKLWDYLPTSTNKTGLICEK